MIDSNTRSIMQRFAGTSPRGGLPLGDLPRGGTYVLMQRDGLWTCGTNLAGIETNPEFLSSNYRKTLSFSYTNTTGTPPVADQILQGSTGAWKVRLVSVTPGAGTTGTGVLSLYSGTSAGQGAETLGVVGSLGDAFTGVTVSPVGATTGYADLSGNKAPFCTTEAAGPYNCIGSPQDLVGDEAGHVNRFPLYPGYYDRSFELPKGEFVRGAELEILMSGVMLNTIGGSSDTRKLVLTLNIADSFFTSTSIGANNFRARMTFATAAVPTITAEEPFMVSIKMTNSRKADRTEGNIALLDFRSQSLACIRGLQRGSDKIVTPTTFTGFDFENGDDLTNKRSRRKVGIWAAVGTNAGLGNSVVSDGECYFNFHTVQVRLTRGPV